MSKFSRYANNASLLVELIAAAYLLYKIADYFWLSSDTDGSSDRSEQENYMLDKDSDSWIRVDAIDVKNPRYGGKCYAVGIGKVYDVGYATIDGKPVRILER
jgi:hypothetical protein